MARKHLKSSGGVSRATKLKSAAIITIHGVGDMTPKGRREIAKWLRHHADMMVAEGKNYTKGRFTGRYQYAA
jgi:hypothetical protein